MAIKKGIHSIHVPLQTQVWAKIRFWQMVMDLPDEELAKELNVSERTIRNYDKDPSPLMLGNVENFMINHDIHINDLLN